MKLEALSISSISSIPKVANIPLIFSIVTDDVAEFVTAMNLNLSSGKGSKTLKIFYGISNIWATYKILEKAF